MYWYIMGLTPVQGLMMGTRAGDVGAGAFQYMMSQENLTIDQRTLNVMNKKSGIFRNSGKSSDLREVLEGMQNGDDRCRLAVMVAYNIKNMLELMLLHLMVLMHYVSQVELVKMLH